MECSKARRVMASAVTGLLDIEVFGLLVLKILSRGLWLSMYRRLVVVNECSIEENLKNALV